MSRGTFKVGHEQSSVDGLPRIGARVRTNCHAEAASALVGTVVGFSVLARLDAATWRDGLGQLVALVELDGSGHWLEGRSVSVSTLVCDLSSIELVDAGEGSS
jgi:hypothetical protein